MLFDTWGGLLSPAQFRRFSLEPMRSVLARLPSHVPTIIFTKGAWASLPAIVDSGAACVGLDWTADLAKARREFGERVAIQGNLDPLALLADAASVERAVADVVAAAGPAPGYVFNVGHGLVPATPPDNVAALVDTVHRVTEREPSRAEKRVPRANCGVDKFSKRAFPTELCTRIGGSSYIAGCDENCTNGKRQPTDPPRQFASRRTGATFTPRGRGALPQHAPSVTHKTIHRLCGKSLPERLRIKCLPIHVEVSD
jgi:hypothetical protein